jgi:uncharacterized protein YdcH (DUF465 family)
MDENEIKDHLRKANEEYKKVFEIHQKCEKELKRYKNQKYLSDDEKLKEKELKKKKLVLKDKLYLIMREYKKSLQS